MFTGHGALASKLRVKVHEDPPVAIAAGATSSPIPATTAQEKNAFLLNRIATSSPFDLRPFSNLEGVGLSRHDYGKASTTRA
jgi:hypothetical protein